MACETFLRFYRPNPNRQVSIDKHFHAVSANPMLKFSTSWKKGLAWAALCLGLLATAFASLQVKRDIEQNAASRYALTCDKVTLEIQGRLGDYALILRGGAALFAASNRVDRQEWRAYVEKLQVNKSVPGVQAIGFAQAIPPRQLASHIARIRSGGLPEYTVHPSGERSIYTSIVFLEPFRYRNVSALGFDLHTEPVSRAAMDQALDTGEAALSGKIRLAQGGDTEAQTGVLMFVPVYRNGAPVDTVGQRRAALIGWTYGLYRVNEIIADVLSDWASVQGKNVELAVYDGHDALPAALIFESRAASLSDVHSLFHQQRTINFNGQQWLLVYDYTGKPSDISYATAWATLTGGIVLSSLLFGLLLSIIKTRAKAISIADKLSEEIMNSKKSLEESEEKIHSLLNPFTAEAINCIDINASHISCDSDACLRLLGYKHPEVLHGENMQGQTHMKSPGVTRLPVEDCPIFQSFIKNDEKIHFLLNSSSTEALYCVDMNGNCTFCNNACLSLLGYKRPQDLLGKNMYQLVHAKHSDGSHFPKEECAIFQACQKGESMHVDDEVLWRSDGTYFPAEYWTYPQSQDGVVVGAAVTFLDISARRQTELELRISSDLLSTVTSSAQDAIIMLDELGNIVFWNESAELIFGYSREEALGQPHTIMVPRSLRKVYRRVFQHFQRTGQGTSIGSTVEFAGLRKDGSEFPLELSYAAVQVKGVHYPIGIVRDITKRKLMENHLALSESEMRTTLYSIGDAVISLDINGCILLMNPVAENLTGWSESEAHGKPLEEVFCIIDEKTRCKLENPIVQVFSERTIVRMKSRILLIARDGTERPIGDSAAPIFNQDNNIIGVVLVFRDLTKEREAEETTLNQLAIIETYNGLVALANMDEKLIYINAGGVEMIGVKKPDDILGKCITDFIKQTNLKRSTDESIPCFVKDRVWNGESTLRRIDGTIIPVAQTIFIIHDTNGEPKHIGIIMMDISIQKEMQERLLMSEKLAVMGRLVADVAHEINNPLAIIIGRTELILSQVDEQSSQFRDKLEPVLHSARRCKTILSSLL